MFQQGDLLRDNGTGQYLEVMGTKTLMGITHFELQNKTTLSHLTLSEHGIKSALLRLAALNQKAPDGNIDADSYVGQVTQL